MIESEHTEVELLRAENEILRGLIVDIREAAVLAAPFIWTSKATEKARKLLADDIAMMRAVTKLLIDKKRTAAERVLAQAAEDAAREAHEASSKLSDGG